MQNTYSFDVFDTVLGRLVDNPKHIFTRAAEKVAITDPIPFSAQVYASERVNAERRLLAKGRFPSLSDIANELATATKLSHYLVTALINKELELERSELWPITTNVALINQARHNGAEIIFISDTYMSSEFLSEILSAHDIRAPHEKVFVSCEHGVSKKNGELFLRVAKLINVPPASIVHHGDNLQADYLGPRKIGATGKLIVAGHLNKYEICIRNFPNRYPVSTNAAVHISRVGALLRKARLEQQPEHSARFTVAIAVAAPLLYWFTRATIDWAESRQIRRLYFLSRDGDILRKIAGRITRANPSAPELRYLHVSRVIAILGNLKPQADAAQLRSLALGFQPNTLKEFIDYVSPTDPTLARAYSPSDLEKSLIEIPLRRVVDPLVKQPSLYQRILNQSADRRLRLQAYLSQEGLVASDVRVGLVDVGWRLTIHDLLASSIIEAGGDAPSGFYFGIDDVSTDSRFGAKDAFMWDARGQPRWPRIEYITRVIEAFCTPAQNRTVDYQLVGHRLTPVFSGNDAALYEQWGVQEVQETILHGCDTLHDLDPPYDFVYWQRLLGRELLAAFWNDPTVEEVQDWGSFPFQITDASQAKYIPLYYPSGPLRKLHYSLRRESVRGNHLNSWTSATRTMTSSAIWLFMRFLASIRGHIR